MSNIIDSIQLSGVTYAIQGGGGGKPIEGGRGITVTTGETADTVSFNLPISAGTGSYSIQEGYSTTASGVQSHAEGWNTVASGSYSHAEGNSTASGSYSHAEGNHTVASGPSSHAEGLNTSATTFASHAEGLGTITKNINEHASGIYNVSNTGSTYADITLFSVGNGEGENTRHNAFEIRQNGDIYITSGSTDIKLQDHLGDGGGGVPESAFTAYTAATDARIAEDEEVTAAGLNALNEAISGISGNNVVELTQAEYDALVDKDPTAFYIITDATAVDLTQYWTSAQTQSAITSAVSTKQDTLVSGTNIKTINNESLLGSGNIDIQGGGKAVTGGTNISVTTGETADTINCTLPISADSKGIYTTSTYPFLSTSNKTGNVVFGYNNRLDTFGSSKSSNYNLFFGSNNYISVNGSGMLIGGLNNKNSGNYTNMTACVALGANNIVRNPYEFASGQFNQTYYNTTSFGDSGNTLFSVGNGTADNARHNAFEIRQNGDIYLTKDGQDVKLQDQLGGGEVSSAITSGDTNAVAGGAVYDKFDEVEQVTAAALNNINDRLSEDEEVTAAGLNAVNSALGGLKLQQITQAAYDALTTKDASTLYIIVN